MEVFAWKQITLSPDPVLQTQHLLLNQKHVGRALSGAHGLVLLGNLNLEHSRFLSGARRGSDWLFSIQGVAAPSKLPDAWKWDWIRDISVYYITGGTGMFMKVLQSWLGFHRGLSDVCAGIKNQSSLWTYGHNLCVLFCLLCTLS